VLIKSKPNYIPANKRLSQLFIISVIFVFAACTEKVSNSDLIIKDNLIYKRGSSVPFTGIEKSLIEDKIIEYEIKDGIKHGSFKLFYADGTLEIAGKIDQNKNVGKWQYFYPGGELESEGYFENDLANGEWLWYYLEGKVREQGSFHKGERIGMWYQYDGDGKIIFEKNFDVKDSSFTAEDSIFSKSKRIPF
jgi:antitoxin component YwqK of YwqJK toxin-antitoxin module